MKGEPSVFKPAEKTAKRQKKNEAAISRRHDKNKREPSSFGWRRKKHLRETGADPETDPNQRQYLIDMILTLDTRTADANPPCAACGS